MHFVLISSLQLLFVYLLRLPSLLTSSIYNCFYTCLMWYISVRVYGPEVQGSISALRTSTYKVIPLNQEPKRLCVAFVAGTWSWTSGFGFRGYLVTKLLDFSQINNSLAWCYLTKSFFAFEHPEITSGAQILRLDLLEIVESSLWSQTWISKRVPI